MLLLAGSLALVQAVAGETPVDRGTVAASWIGILVLALIILVATLVSTRSRVS